MSSVILKLVNELDVNEAPLRRIRGEVAMRGLIDLITNEELQANPRHSKRSNITKDIEETLQTNPVMMRYYSKGLLIGASEVILRDRHRYQIEFVDPYREGILDGGHNALAIGITLLQEAGIDEKEIKKIKVWNDLKECWMKHLADVEKLKQAESTPTLDALVPVEILTSVESKDGEVDPALFKELILGICANRNQNAQLAAESMANQSGIFDFLKAALPQEIVNAVAWRTNDKGRVDPRALVALTWVTLSKVPTLEKYGVQPVAGTGAYSGKAEALNRFTKLMEAEGAAEKTKDGNSFVVIDPYLASAFDLVPDVLKCYDLFYREYRGAYNANNGTFGRINAVKKVSKGKNYTMFSNELVDGDVPPLGFLMPVVFSLQSLIKVNKDEKKLEWLTSPYEFFSNKNNLNAVVGAVKPIIEMAGWDPQRVGKGSASYNAAAEKARNLVLESLIG